MNKFIFTKKSEKEFLFLDKEIQNRVLKKLLFLKNIEDLSAFLKVLVNFSPATHRLRVWNYRLILKKEDTNYIILSIWIRWSIYK